MAFSQCYNCSHVRQSLADTRDSVMHNALGTDSPRQTFQLNIVVDISTEERVRKGIEEITKAVFPLWDVSKISVRVLTGGLTNKLFVCEYSPNGQKFLTRIFGEKTQLFIDRNAELQNMIFLHQNGLGPKVHCAFSNGLCYDYVAGEMFSLEMVADPIHSHKIAIEMARLHSIPNPSFHSDQAKIVNMLEDYLRLVPPKVLQSAEKNIGNEFNRAVCFSQEVAILKEVYSDLKCPVVFCHNDLLSKNILLDGNEAHFIDFEYASPNYQAFDIGNFFVEFGGQESYDRSLYPKKEWQSSWIEVYYTEYSRLKGIEPLTDATLSRLYIEVNKLALASMILWGLWGLIQKANSTIDADFEAFALGRLGMYFHKRDQFLAL